MEKFTLTRNQDKNFSLTKMKKESNLHGKKTKGKQKFESKQKTMLDEINVNVLKTILEGVGETDSVFMNDETLVAISRGGYNKKNVLYIDTLLLLDSGFASEEFLEKNSIISICSECNGKYELDHLAVQRYELESDYNIKRNSFITEVVDDE